MVRLKMEPRLPRFVGPDLDSTDQIELDNPIDLDIRHALYVSNLQDPLDDR